MLGLDILYTTPASSYAQNLATAQSLGVQVLPFSLDWDEIEPDTPTICDAGSSYTDPFGSLAAFNALLPDAGMAASLNIRTVNTNLLAVPVSLQANAFDGGQAGVDLMACRFDRMLDFVFARIPDLQLVSLQIGNEIDDYPGASAVDFWSSYWSFFAQVSAYARTKRPGLQVGVTSTFTGLVGTSANPLAQGGLAQINKIADLTGFTYYPLDGSGRVRDPSVVQSDFAAAVAAAAPGLPIFVLEAGYPSDGASCGSSQAMQASFVEDLFGAWDANASRIAYVSFLRLDDYSDPDAINAAGGYGLGSSAAFVAFLETLGLEQYDGGIKPALQALGEQAALRGW